jgi:N-methylhydantoinase B
MKASNLVTDISELEGTPQTLQLRQQDFDQSPSDVYAVLWSAGGGFGDPLERDPAKVEADVDNGDVSAESAREIYGVILGDADATAREREGLRKKRIEGQSRGVKKLEGKISFLATDSLAVKGNQYCCAKCSTALGPVKGNYKDHCVRLDRKIQASNPIVGDPQRFIDATPQFRQFCCPGCGLLIENEIAVADEPLLRDVEIQLR